ncbi:hypothetical protein EUX98_g8273 [Antrodiella citrinella]|uniref:Alpha/beta hydrolase fold-3 domain-containing protein n=1 Tax=Antrodiella citrinella TaxID=2447956 RepID=A0A4S4M8Y4_9APHY|nr:hypothetical protein EUX98_g8273 [Antrodiella citrinella]
MSDSPYAHYAVMDPEYAALVAQLPPNNFPLDPLEGRKVMNDIVIPLMREQQRAAAPDASKYKTVDHSVHLADMASILVRTITPVSSEGNTYPVLYWIHGGGYIFGSADMIEFKMASAAVDLQIAVAMVEYRLAPEHPHPISVNDCFEGLKWTADNAASFAGDISKGFIVAGDSAGGSLSATLTHLARDDPFFQGKQLTGQILQIPNVIDPRAVPEQYKRELRSMDTTENAKYAGLTRDFLHNMYKLNLKNSPTDPTASPLLFPSHAYLPPALVQISGLDLLRDEGLLYEKVLKLAGVKTKLHVYPGVSHGFHMLFTHLAAAKKFEQDWRDGIQWLLAGANQ